MDGKSQLRRFLEQRRDLGESEYVLDGMSVEEALQALGAVRSGALKRRAKPAVQAEPATELADTSRAAEPAQADASPVARDPEPNEIPAPKQATAPGRADPFKKGEREAPAPIAAELLGADLRERMAQGLVVGGANGALFTNNPFSNVETLEGIAALVQECTRCPLYKTATNGVPGEGNPVADLMCVGEAPGANEDATGRPFVGQAGQLLTKILAAIDLAREDVFIANVLKHRPPGNRNPQPNEVSACSPYLVRQIEIIRPKVILALGTFAAQTLLETKTSIGKLRGAIHRYYGVPLIVTYHPAALLRNPAWKRPTWEDVQLARRVLDSAGA